MTCNCVKPMECEKVKNGLSISIIVRQMLTKHKQIIHDQIQKFLDAGGKLQSLTLDSHADGTLILRSDQRTVVTVRVKVEGRKVGGATFKCVDPD